MSFLNPVNEPVKRFKSTDAGAPQINYNARVAGDVKAVLKACLVTGYGSTSSAGWTAVNEVNHVADFVSPSAAMSDYRLGIDDTSAANTTWYYQYQDVRVNPQYGSPTKTFTEADKVNAANGWQLLVTERGFIFIELLQHRAINKVSARMTYFSQVKSGLVDAGGVNMMFFNIGHDGTTSELDFYKFTYPHFRLAGNSSPQICAATPFHLQPDYTTGVSVMDLASPLYVKNGMNTADGYLLAQLPALLSQVVNQAADMYGVKEQALSARPVLSICCGYPESRAQYAYSRGRTFLIHLDYWEY